MFQYSTFDGDSEETDASGLCSVTYVSSGPHSLKKVKRSCVAHNLPPKTEHPNAIYGVQLVSTRETTYDLTQSLIPEKIAEEESHKMTLAARPEAGTTIVSQRHLRLLPEVLNQSPVTAKTYKEAVAILESGFTEASIELQPEPVTCPDYGCPTVSITFALSTNIANVRYEDHLALKWPDQVVIRQNKFSFKQSYNSSFTGSKYFMTYV